MKIDRQIYVELVGRGCILLRPNDYLATGGEASVYRKEGTVIKLYTNPRKLLEPGMVEKLTLLSNLKHEAVVAPRGLVLDDHSNPIGYWMDFVDGDEALASIFTNDYRQRSGFGDSEANDLVDQMLRVMTFAHESGAIMIDPNELNWTTVGASGTKRAPRVLDVDSWHIGSRLPATVALMPSIRDWHTPKLGVETDRFALGVVTFQVYAGIHPYKGTLDGYKRSELERRMKDRASVFTPGVGLNQAVRDFGCIPGPLLAWYEAAFQGCERSAPPSPYYTGVTQAPRTVSVKRIITTSSGSLKYDRLFDRVGDPVTRVFPCGVILLRSGTLVDLTSGREIARTNSNDVEVAQMGGGWVVAEGRHDPKFTFVSQSSFEPQPLQLDASVQNVVRYQNRMFVVLSQGLTELSLKHFARPILSIGQMWQAMANSTRWFDGVGVMDAMGSMFLIVPFNDNACAQVRVRELDGMHVVVAKSGPRFVTVVAADSRGSYHKFELTFDRSYASYTAWRTEVDGPELNVSLLPRGVMATVVKDGELVIFVPTTAVVNRVADRDITTKVTLGNWGDKVVFLRDGQLWQVSMT